MCFISKKKIITDWPVKDILSTQTYICKHWVGMVRSKPPSNTNDKRSASSSCAANCLEEHEEPKTCRWEGRARRA
jgi:hypothetical protein